MGPEASIASTEQACMARSVLQTGVRHDADYDDKQPMPGPPTYKTLNWIVKSLQLSRCQL